MSNIIFKRQGSIVFSHTEGLDEELLSTVPAGIYSVQSSEILGIHLRREPDVTVPSKVYGNLPELAKRIVTTYQSRPGNTGVLAEGDKGNGKSLLLKLVICELVQLGVPVLMVANAYGGQNFQSFLERFQQPIAIVFDEFDKVYRSQDSGGGRTSQEGLLSILDGTASVGYRRLCFFTTNSPFGVDRHMLNRPSRIFYLFRFEGVDDKFAREYAEHRLDNKAHIDGLVLLFKRARSNFDVLQSIVEEMNRYRCTAVEAATYLNFKFETRQQHYTLVDVRFSGEDAGKYTWRGYPRQEFYFDPGNTFSLYLRYFKEPAKNDGEEQEPRKRTRSRDRSADELCEVHLTDHHITSIDDDGRILMTDEEGVVYKLTTRPQRRFDLNEHYLGMKFRGGGYGGGSFGDEDCIEDGDE